MASLKFSSRITKALAIVLSLVMLFSVIPLSSIFNASALEVFFVEVIDKDTQEGISDATVTIIPAEGSGLNTATASTKSDGKATFDEIAEYFNNASEPFEATYQVTATNYADVVVEEAVTLSADGLTVEMQANIIEGITVTAYSDKYDGESHDAVKVEGTVDGDVVTYSTDGGNVFTAEVPTVKFPDDKATVCVKVERANYNDFVSSEYTAEVAKGVIEGITVTPYEGIYDYASHDAVKVEGTVDGDTIEYSTDSGSTYSEDVPTVNEVGSKTVKVKISREYYEDYYSQEVAATVIPAEIEGITITPYADVYDGEEHDAISSIVGTKDGDKVFYSTDKVSYTEEMPTVKNAGIVSVYVKIQRANHNDYVTFPTCFNATVEKAEIENVVATGYEGIYNPNKSFDAITKIEIDPTKESINDGATDTYTYSKDGKTFEADKPTVKAVADSGTYYVKVNRGDNYAEKILEVEVEIKKAEQNIYFEEVSDQIYKENNKFTFQINSFKGKDNDSEFDATDSDHTVTYSLVSGPAGTQVDAKTGEVTYTSVGVIKVKASVPECANYLDAEAEYTVEVKYAKSPEFKLPKPDYTDNNGTEDDKTDDTKWYKQDVEIEPVDTEDDSWQIIESSSALGQDGWSETITKTAEGKYSLKVAFKNQDGEITDLVEIDKFAIDKTAPEVTKFEISEQTVTEKVINFLTFGIFAHEDVDITVNVKDEGVSSGLNDVELYESGKFVKALKVDADGTATFTVSADSITNDYGKLKVVLSAKVSDKVGQESAEKYITNKDSNLEETSLMLEKTSPTIENVKDVAISGNVTQALDRRIYNKDARIFFDVKDVDSGLYSVDVKVNGEKYNGIIKINDKEYTHESSVGYVVQPEDEKEKPLFQVCDVQRFEITTEGLQADADGKYVFEITVVDCAGNETKKEVTVYKDQTSPVITGFKVTAEVDKEEKVIPNEDLVSVDDKKDEDRKKPIDIDDYGYYFNQDVKVYVTAEDFRSSFETNAGVSKIHYVAVGVNADGEQVIIEGEGEEGKTTVSFVVEKDFKGQIYAYAEDTLGNSAPNGQKFFEIDQDNDSKTEDEYDASDYDAILVAEDKTIIVEGQSGINLNGYVYPNGAIVESQEKHDEIGGHISISTPKTDYTQNNGKKLYNKDVKVEISVKDEYSGIRTVEWYVKSKYDEGNNNYGGVLTVDNKGDITYSEYVNADETKLPLNGTEWSIDKKDRNLATLLTNAITVSNNSNDIVVYVKMTDRAGNVSKDKVIFGIDKTAPKISVEYDKNEIHDEKYSNYFKTNRTAKVTITERNFRKDDVDLTIKTEHKGSAHIGKWKTNPDTTNPDSTTHVLIIKYTADNDYTFDIAYKDNANNKADDFKKQKFTIDKTLPVVNVDYDNNTARNEIYYKESRIATITIKEHNFDASRVEVVGTASETTFPKTTQWKNVGEDTYQAKISYAKDSRYTFDIEFRDKAGNKIKDYEKEEFVIDMTAPTLSITGVADKSANATDDNIGFVVQSNDTNFDSLAVTLSGKIMEDGKVVDLEEQDLPYSEEDKTNKVGTYVVTNIEKDGVYIIGCEATDKAGNTFEKVALEDEDGAEYIVNSPDKENIVTFSVNRDGSTFMLDSNSEDLVEKYYTTEVKNDVVVYEYNPDKILKKTVTLNGKELKEGEDYTVSLPSSENWHKYKYVIKKSLFASEGEYNIVISSKDKASNQAFSDVKGLNIKFVVDKSTPTISVVGLKSNGRYQTDTQVVTIAPTDAGGMLESVLIRMVDSDGKEIKVLKDLSGDALFAELEKGEGKLTFKIASGLYQNVQIICKDKAGNIFGAKDSEIYKDVSVSASAFMIFWANRPLRWGVIIGIVLLLAAVIFFVAKKKKSK